MTLPAFFTIQNSDLSTFLYAEVGEERNGMALTVVSTIARIGRDPWEEASRLAALPKASATSQLAQIIQTTNWSPAEASTIASRLVQLLPTNSGTAVSGSTFSFHRFIFCPAGVAAFIYGALAAFFIVNLLLQNAQVMNKLIDNPIVTNGSRNRGTSTAVISADIADVAPMHPSMPELTGD